MPTDRSVRLLRIALRIKAAELLGARVVNQIERLIETPCIREIRAQEISYIERMDKEREARKKCDQQVDELLRVVVALKEAVETYYEGLEQEYDKKYMVVSEFENAKKTILEAGKLFEEDAVLFEVLTSDVPLLRTVSALYAKLSKEKK